MEPDRYFGFISKQRNKLDYIEGRLIPEFRRAVDELPPSPSLRSVAQWLREQGVPTSSNEKAQANWVPQTVLDCLRIAQSEPTPDILYAPPNKRFDGFLVSSQRFFEGARPTMEMTHGDERVVYEEKRLREHHERIRRLSREMSEIFPRFI